MERLYDEIRGFGSSRKCYHPVRADKSQLNCAGHVFPMEKLRLGKLTIHGVLSTGHRDKVAPEKRYVEYLLMYFAPCHIDHHKCSTIAANRRTSRLLLTRSSPLKPFAVPTSRSCMHARLYKQISVFILMIFHNISFEIDRLHEGN